MNIILFREQLLIFEKQNYGYSHNLVRWSSVYALGEIAKFNTTNQKNIIERLEELMENEKNNGVKNVFNKAHKDIEKQSKNK